MSLKKVKKNVQSDFAYYGVNASVLTKVRRAPKYRSSLFFYFWQSCSQARSAMDVQPAHRLLSIKRENISSKMIAKSNNQ